MSGERISRGRLHEIRSDLSDRDVAVLESVATNRFLTSHQIRRTHFADHATKAASTRSTNRALARLAGLGLVAHLARRIGGTRAGSGSHVWTLTEAGVRLLRATGDIEGLPVRLRAHEPTSTFLEHTLAIAEVCLRLSEADRDGGFSLVELLREPECWKAYSGRHGDVIHLRPDLSAVTVTGDYEDHWFFEVDRNTEPPSRIIRKCQTYEAYRQTGAEEKRVGVFPAVVWVTPSAKRAATLQDHIAKAPELSRGVFAVVQIDDLPALVGAGIGSRENSHGA